MTSFEVDRASRRISSVFWEINLHNRELEEVDSMLKDYNFTRVEQCEIELDKVFCCLKLGESEVYRFIIFKVGEDLNLVSWVVLY